MISEGLIEKVMFELRCLGSEEAGVGSEGGAVQVRAQPADTLALRSEHTWHAVCGE